MHGLFRNSGGFTKNSSDAQNSPAPVDELESVPFTELTPVAYLFSATSVEFD
ncbi:MAG TPA: hypothetical protein PLU53_07390 [Bacteroidia bacterium]|nr:hypothetical protein [Bacteroidia bacterium]